MILVVGATGNIGSEVVRLLQVKGVATRVMVRDKAKAASMFGDGVEVVTGDLREPDSLPAALEGVDKAFLVTALALDQVAMRNAFIDAAAKSGVKHVVLSSGIGAGPDAAVQFGRWHGENQERLKQSGLDWTFVQPTFFMQNFFMSAATIKDHGAFYLPLGENSPVSWVDARDIATVATTALTEPGHEGKAYPVTGPAAVTAEEIAEVMTAELGKPVRYVAVSNDDARAAMLDVGMPVVLADAMIELYALAPPGYLGEVADTLRAVTSNPGRDIRMFVSDYKSAFS
jgi:uncharacterized protein YbjT (DUF2867 family)